MKQTSYLPEDLIPIVAELARGYVGSDHTSITYETAQGFMEAVLYCIHEFEDSNSSALPAVQLPAREAYRLGSRFVTEKLRQLNKLYDRLLTDFHPYGSQCLSDTIIRGIPAFLLNYDAKYAPQETILTLDYPVLKKLETLAGIDAVWEYVSCISLEQQFFRKLDSSYILQVLRTYHDSYETLMENICTPVLQNILAYLLLNKPPSPVPFSREEYLQLEEFLFQRSDREPEQLLTQALRRLIDSFFDGDMLLFDYLNHAVSDIATNVRVGRLCHQSSFRFIY